MFTAGQALNSLVASADGRRIVAGGANGAVSVFDTDTRQVQQIRGVTAFEADQIDISPDGRYVATVSVPVASHAQGGLDWQLAVVDLEMTPPEGTPTAMRLAEDPGSRPTATRSSTYMGVPCPLPGRGDGARQRTPS